MSSNTRISEPISADSGIPLKYRGALSTDDAAVYLSTTPGTLKVLRHRGEGPPYRKNGSRVLYVVADLDEWLSNLPRGDR